MKSLPKQILPSVVAAAFLLAALAGCGGGPNIGDPGTSTYVPINASTIPPSVRH